VKINEAINQLDALKPNTYSGSEKIVWLSRLDAMIKKNIIDTHEGGDVTFTGYDEGTDQSTELIVAEPYDEMYIRWLEAQIDYANGEYERYNNSVELFNTAYEEYKKYYNRTHTPKSKEFKYF
jgi:hypothetical protein